MENPLPRKTLRSFLKASIPLEKGDKCKTRILHVNPSCLRIPSREGWREGEVLRRLHAVAARRGGFFFINAHPEAFGFRPSREGI